MILIWGLKTDTPTAMIRQELELAGADFLFLDQRKVFLSEIRYAFGHQNELSCTLNVGGETVDLRDVHLAYIRPYNFRDFPEMDGKAIDDPAALKAAGFESQLIAWLNASDAMVINKTDPAATNNSKPYQLSLIREAGFLIPKTFIVNDVAAAKSFIKENGPVVYKSISGVRSIVHQVTGAHMEFINDVQWCPTIFQKVISGVNYRVHVIGEEIFAVRIQSDRLDYRYGKTTMVSEELPGAIAVKCLLLNKMIGLHFSGIDLMRTPDDEWYCFEVNPSPGFSYFQQLSGAPISTALARFMIENDHLKSNATQLIVAES